MPPPLSTSNFPVAATALFLLVGASWTTATELTFDIVGFGNFSNMSDEYGDRVTATTMGDFSYGAAGGFTPNVSVSYGRDPADPAFWTQGYGDLENILFEDADSVGILEITLTADAGYAVRLQRWDMAAYSSDFTEAPIIDRVEVRDGSSQALFTQVDVAISQATRTSFDFTEGPLQGSTLILRFESTNLGNLSDDIAIDNIVFSQTVEEGGVVDPTPGEGCDPPRRLTFDSGNERLPSWDPRGGLIAFTTDREDGEWNDIGGVNADGSDERLLAKGPQTPFGLAAGPLSWVGSSAQLITNEAVGIHEYLALAVDQTPFTRTRSSGEDAAFTPKLLVDGGGGGGFLKVSRDGSMAVWRFSRSGGGGRTTIHTAPYDSLVGQSASSHGTVHIDVDTGAEQRFLQGVAIAPDGSFFVISQPAGSGHDLWLYTSDASAAPVALTTSGESDGAWNRFPDISPDGSQVVFTFWTGSEGETNDIHILSLSGGNATNLTNTFDLSEAWPTWAPDGNSIAYGRFDAAGSPGLVAGEEANTNLYVLCLDAASGGGNGDSGGGNLPTSRDVFLESGDTILYERITQLTAADDGNIAQMALSGDGSKIIYSTRDKNVYTLNADGSEKRLIFQYADLRGGCPCLAPWVTISHDGTQIAWTDTANEIFTAASDGSNRREIASLVNIAGSEREPVFGGSGIHLAKNGKLYYQIYMGRRGDAAEASGLFESNPDGTGLRKLFGFLELWPVVPREPDQSVDPGKFAVSDDGGRLILNYDLQDPASFFGPGAFHPGALATWDRGIFSVINPTKPAMDIDVAISGDGNVIAYEDGSEPDLLVNTFEGNAENSVLSVAGFNNFDFRLNEDGTVISADTNGTEGSILVTLLSTDGKQRLDLMPTNWNATPILVRLSADGRRLVWTTTWKSPEAGRQQVWTLDINPVAIAGAFPQITNPVLEPALLQQDGSSTTVFSAAMANVATETWFVGMVDGQVRSPNGGGIGRFSFEFFDDGTGNDPSPGDGRYYTEDIPAFRNPELGAWTIRMGGQNERYITVVDVPGLRVVDGQPAETQDSDQDGVSDFLEDAFGSDPNARDAGGLPTSTTVMDGDQAFLGLALTVPDGSSVTPENTVVAEGFRYTFELSDDLTNWRPAGADVVIANGAIADGRLSLIVRFATALRDATDDCYIRIQVTGL